MTIIESFEQDLSFLNELKERYWNELKNYSEKVYSEYLGLFDEIDSLESISKIISIIHRVPSRFANDEVDRLLGKKIEKFFKEKNAIFRVESLYGGEPRTRIEYRKFGLRGYSEIRGISTETIGEIIEDDKHLLIFNDARVKFENILVFDTEEERDLFLEVQNNF